MSGYLNLASFILGIFAWILPIISLIQNKKHKNSKWAFFSIMSLSACAIALCFQIFYHYHLVKIEDWSALMDITGGVVLVSGVLLVVTIMLNMLNLIVFRYKTEE